MKRMRLIQLRNWLLKRLANGHPVMMNIAVDGKRGIVTRSDKAFLLNIVISNFGTGITIVPKD